MKNRIYKILAAIGIGNWVVKVYKNISNFFLLWYYARFNEVVARQNKDYKSIPIIIISFNQLKYLKQLIDFLKERNYSNIVIVDNNSTYEPLLDYFKSIENEVVIHRLRENSGHLVFWNTTEIFQKYAKGYYVVTDADINPISQCPEDFVLHFKKILDSNPLQTKVGFSLKIDDIPHNNPNKETIVKWESQFWKKTICDGNFIADIDTTFAIYRPHYERKPHNFIKGIRTQYPYQAKHGGWYIDLENLSAEEKFYRDTCTSASSWRTDAEGNLKSHIYKR